LPETEENVKIGILRKPFPRSQQEHKKNWKEEARFFHFGFRLGLRGYLDFTFISFSANKKIKAIIVMVKARIEATSVIGHRSSSE
tara:strand:- start:14886 stop:15140 length:255 start_codon:yes stop_codon:yes gene_type:complete